MNRQDFSINDFAEAVKEHLFDNHPEMVETHTIDVSEVTKNNGTILHGLTIKEIGERIAPTIYLEKFFEDFKEGKSLGEIADKIIAIYSENQAPKSFSIDFFTDFDQAKDRLAMKIVNAEKNAEMLSGMPHFKFGDLAAIFQVQVDASEYGNAVITVKDEHMQMWRVSTQTLMDYAKANMEEHQPVRIKSMMDVLSEIMGDMPEELNPGEGEQMYVMSNETKINGAAAMIFTDKLDEFAQELGTNLFILPSSVHEILLVPDRGMMDVAELESMVRDVNSTQVAPDEVLSDNVYYYDKDVKSLYIAATNEPCILESDGKDFSKGNRTMSA